MSLRLYDTWRVFIVPPEPEPPKFIQERTTKKSTIRAYKSVPDEICTLGSVPIHLNLTIPISRRTQHASKKAIALFVILDITYRYHNSSIVIGITGSCSSLLFTILLHDEELQALSQ
jgi:hypothetical protein